MDNLERLKAMWRTDDCSLRVEALRWAIEQLEWQPIDTAPKDGTTILAFSKATGAITMLWIDGRFCDPVSFSSMREGPTHWKPITEPDND